MIFWIIVGGMTLALAGAFAVTIARGTGSGSDASDIAVYRDQLAEVDRDVDRGVLSGDAAERARTEIARRILAADKRGGTDPGVAPAPRRAVLAGGGALVLVLVGAIAGYVNLGAPGFSDRPLSARIEAAKDARGERPSQAEAEAGFVPPPGPAPDPRTLELVERLREVLATRGDDIQGLTLLASNEANLGNFPAARAAQQRLILAKGEDATLADLATLVDLMVFAGDGVVTPETDQVLSAILGVDPTNPVARYYLGLMHAQTGRPDLSFNLWKALLEEGPEDAPWIPPIRASITDLAHVAGVRYTPPAPAGLPGPDADDIAAAAEMDEADRMEMIQGMVDGLAARLAEEGGTAQDWARLITALGVLGDADRAQAIWDEAQVVFGADAGGLAAIRAAAQSAGVAR